LEQEGLEDIVQFITKLTVHHTFNTHGLDRLMLEFFVNQSLEDRLLYNIQEASGRISVIVKSLIGLGH
jgi:hypothetical protein